MECKQTMSYIHNLIKPYFTGFVHIEYKIDITITIASVIEVVLNTCMILTLFMCYIIIKKYYTHRTRAIKVSVSPFVESPVEIECMICFEDTQIICKPGCNHELCVVCMCELIKTSLIPTCPMCRQQITQIKCHSEKDKQTIQLHLRK